MSINDGVNLMIAERLTQLLPSVVDPSRVTSSAQFTNGNPIELSYIMAKLDDFQFELINTMYLGEKNSEYNVKAMLLNRFILRVKRDKNEIDHIPALIHTELKEVLGDNICEVCEGNQYYEKDNLFHRCSYCGETGKANPSLKTKSTWYAEIRKKYLEQNHKDKKYSIQKLKQHYILNLGDAYKIFSHIVNNHNKAVRLMESRLR